MEKGRCRVEDRLSALPDIILIEILSLLPLETAVAASTLSRRWLHLYTRLSSLTLYFTKPVSSHHDIVTFWNKFHTFFSKLALPLSSSLILHLRYNHFPPHWPYLSDSWFRQYCGPSMEIIRVISKDDHFLDDEYYLVVPTTHIFTMKSLKVLELGGSFAWTLPSHDDVSICLPKLNKLSIHVTSSQFCLFGNFISSITSIEDLSFSVKCRRYGFHNDRQDVGIDHISLVCPNLKRLDANIYPRKLKTKVIVDAPKLQNLQVSSYSSRFYFSPKITDLLEVYIEEWSNDSSQIAVFEGFEAVCNVRNFLPEDFIIYVHDRFVLPSASIFQMQSLRVLELGGHVVWSLPCYTSFHLPYLNKLSIHFFSYQFHLLETLIDSMPSLEDLSFWITCGPSVQPNKQDHVAVDHITLISPNLKRLYASIDSCYTILEPRVIIDAPKLQFLEVESFASRFYFVQKLTALLEANIRRWSYDSSQRAEFDVLEAACMVRNLRIEMFDKLSTLLAFPKLTRLVLMMTLDSKEAIEELLLLLKGCPVLEILKLDYVRNQSKGWNPSNRTPGSMLTYVKIFEVNIHSYPVENTLILVRYMLQSACALEQLKVKFSNGQNFRTANEDLQFLKELVECQNKLLHCHIDYSSSVLKLSCDGSELIEKLSKHN